MRFRGSYRNNKPVEDVIDTVVSFSADRPQSAIFGTFSFDESKISINTLIDMANILDHRGPDASGFHTDGFSAIGNCRLSIIDLSESSNMISFFDRKYFLFFTTFFKKLLTSLSIFELE